MHDPAQTVIGYIVDVQGNALTATLVEDEQGHAPMALPSILDTICLYCADFPQT